jgi:uncharacterized membrane protein (DUF2068 family)
MSSVVEPPAVETSDSSRFWLRAIGVFKLLKALLLVMAGIGLFRLVHHDAAEVLSRWASAVHVDPGNRYFQKVLAKLWWVDDRKLKELGIGTFFYAGLFLTEGLGLLFQKLWAEYLTILLTGSFIPLEVRLTVRHFTAVRALTLLANLFTVAYLIAHRASERRRRRTLPRRWRNRAALAPKRFGISSKSSDSPGGRARPRHTPSPPTTMRSGARNV